MMNLEWWSGEPKTTLDDFYTFHTLLLVCVSVKKELEEAKKEEEPASSKLCKNLTISTYFVLTSHQWRIQCSIFFFLRGGNRIAIFS